MHDEGALPVEDVVEGLLSRLWTAEPAQVPQFGKWCALLECVDVLERACLHTSLHLAIELVNLGHDLVPVEKRATFLLLEAVSDSLSDRNQEPQVAGAHLSDLVPEVGECQGGGYLLVSVVSLVDLAWLEQDLLV